MAYPKRTARKSMTSSCPKRRRAKRTRSLILARTLCWPRCVAISTTSPNQEGVEGTDSEEVWICTDPSAILVICASLRESVCFFLLKEGTCLSLLATGEQLVAHPVGKTTVKCQTCQRSQMTSPSTSRDHGEPSVEQAPPRPSGPLVRRW